MLRLFSGLLHYQLETEFPARFWKSKKQLILLDRAIGESEERARSLRQIVDRSDLEFELFEQRISGQLERIRGMRSRVAGLLKRQEQHINTLAIEAIRQQQQHIVQLRLNARFELAKLYDKMAAEQ
jgi:predicted  nucleic acid-binding Zn-ribbon protein